MSTDGGEITYTLVRVAFMLHNYIFVMYAWRRVDNIDNHGYEIHISQTTSMISGRSNWSIFIIHERVIDLGSNNAD